MASTTSSPLLTDPRWSASFWNAFRNNVYFFTVINMLVQNPVGILWRSSATRRCGCGALSNRNFHPDDPWAS